MAHKPHERDDEQVGDRILSDFTTEPETAGYTHGTWALAVIVVGVALVVAPILFPWYLSVPSMLAVIAVVWLVFSATPPHLSPTEFVRYRLQHRVSQQVFVRGASRVSARRPRSRGGDGNGDGNGDSGADTVDATEASSAVDTDTNTDTAASPTTVEPTDD